MKKKIVVLLVFVLVVGLFTACGGGGGTKTEDDPVVVYTPDIFNTMVPYDTTANSDQMVFDQVYETLAVTQDDGSVVPCLATDWTISDDGLEYTFNLVQDATFHNGENMKASDVVFSFEKFMETAAKKNFVEMIQSVEAVDDYTVKFTLSKVTPLFLVYTNEVPIMSEKFVTENNGEFNDKACGTGPYELVSIDLATAAELKRFEDYRLEPAAIPNVEIRYVSDTSTATVQLETGEIDVMKVEPTQMESIEGNDKFEVKEVPTLKTAVFAINCTVEPLDNKLVRQALNYACDKQTIIDVAYEGYATPAQLQASDTNCFGVDFSDAEEVTYDPEHAKELLAEAGYPDGLNLSDYGVVLDVMGGTYLEKAAQIYQQNLADIGVTIELRNTSTPDEDAESGNFSMMTQTLSYRADFSYNVCQYGTSGIGGNNFSQLSDPYIDEMFAKAESETDQAKRQDMYRELIAYIIDQAPSVPIFHHELIYAWSDRLNCVVHESTVHPYYIYEWSFADAE